MPFWSIVILLVKWAIAAIPAAIIVFIVAGVLVAGIGALGVLAGLGSLATRAALNTTSGRLADNGSASEGPALVVTIRPTEENSLEIRNDTDESWSGCSLTVHGRGGTIGELAAHGAVDAPTSEGISTIDQSAIAVHCLKPHDRDARVYFFR